MKYISKLPLWILGLIYFVFGLNGFFQFLPMPELPDSAKGLLTGMMSASYFFPVLKGTEVACGLLLLVGKAVPLALVILAPITLQIFLFHFFLTPGDVLMPIVMVALHVYLGYVYRASFKPLFK